MTQLSRNLNEARAMKIAQPSVSDLMTYEVITLSPEDNLKRFSDLVRWKSIRHVPIVDAEERLVGLFTQRDLLAISISKLAHIAQSEIDEAYSRILMKDVMGRKVQTVTADTSLREAAEILWSRKFGCLPVVDGDGRLEGIITEADFVRAFMSWDVTLRQG